ncbi:MAG TPA: iron uptake transporter permease EfeU [Cellulomonadaceae bacterium]|nr:iron uptake transporter permease EfeU [Cellulomonadaceae bacterium]
MLATYLIGLREGLEAALVIGILVAYLVKSDRRSSLPFLRVGVGAALLVSLGFGALLTFGPRDLGSTTRAAIGGILSIAAVALVTWMIFWMGRTARHLRTDLQHRLDGALAAGPVAVLIVALLAVGREGLETALFLWAAASATGSTSEPLLGATLGLATALVLGWLIYRGALRLDLRVFFAWTGVFLVVVAAGVLAYGVHDLQEAGLLPGEHALAFDASAVVPAASWYGSLLAGVLNFTAETSWLQAVTWVAYVAPVLTTFVRSVWFSAPHPRQPSTAVAVHAGGAR